jgi:hypothetical protein
MGSSPERKGRGKGEREGERERGCRCGAPWGGGRGGLHEGRRACSLAATAVRGLFMLAVREKKEEGRRKREEKGKKEKNMQNFLNLKIFGEKNKRQFMKLVKKLFLYKKGIILIIIK